MNVNSFLLDYTDFWGRNDPDMLEVGNGNLTLEQGVITRRLMNDSFNNVHEASSDVNIAALISLLIFDVRQILLYSNREH